jgi:5-methylcytosine-specific restriction enzyme subunit McrC
LKTTLVDLLGFKKISKIQKSEIRRSLMRMGEVDSIELSMSQFGQVNLNRNNQHYKLALHIAELIAQNTVLNESDGKKVFVDIGRDHQKLAKLFERFAFQFYKKHSGYRVKKERINWLSDRFDYLPTMNTDITLESDSRKIIIDTKFYGNTLGSRGVDFGANKFHSANLYQIFSYVSNVAGSSSHSMNHKTEGILLYPTVDVELSEKFIIKDHPISVFTVDLNVEWQLIHDRMMVVLKF